MSDKLIKASDAVDIVAKHSALYGNGEISTDDGEALLYDIMSEIMNMPSTQPERCEDCENFGKTRLLIPQPEKRTEGRIKQLPSAQPDGEYISQQAVTESDLIDWYINSVDESEPVWTEEHIYELFNDFYLIPKENR